MKKILTAAVFAAASLSFVAGAQAYDFPATPINHGPFVPPGMAQQSMAAPMMAEPMSAPPMRKRMMRKSMKRKMMKKRMAKKAM